MGCSNKVKLSKLPYLVNQWCNIKILQGLEFTNLCTIVHFITVCIFVVV